VAQLSAGTRNSSRRTDFGFRAAWQVGAEHARLLQARGAVKAVPPIDAELEPLGISEHIDRGATCAAGQE